MLEEGSCDEALVCFGFRGHSFLPTFPSEGPYLPRTSLVRNAFLWLVFAFLLPMFRLFFAAFWMYNGACKLP